MATAHPQSTSGPNSARIHLRTFGGVSVLDATGRPIHPAAALRRPIAVLIVAAAAGDRGIARDKVVGLLWPDFHPDRARHSLTQAIYNARKVTGIDDLFLTDGALRVNPTRVSSDIGAFEGAAQCSDFEGVVAQYDGPFLDGFFVPDTPDFEEWASINRARFEERVVSALEKLRARADDSGDDRQAIEWARRLTALTPLDSDAAEALAIRLARAGDRAGGLRAAQAHIAALKAQLDLEPDQRFLQLLDSLRAVSRVADDRAIASSVTLPSRRIVLPGAPSAPTRWVRSFILTAIGAAGVVVAAYAGARVPGRQVGGAAERGATRVLVAPFGTSGADSSLSYLGPGVAQLIARRLDSAGALTVDDTLLSRSWQAGASRGVGDSVRWNLLQSTARRGVRRIIYGSVIGASTRTIVSATEVEVPGGRQLARATVEGAADSVGRIVTRLVAKLLVAEAGEDSTFAVGWNTSIPALSAFLQGRRAARQFAYLKAAQRFRVALALDTTFAPAALHLARMAERLGDANGLDAAIAQAWPYRASLTPGDRSELTALAGPEYPSATTRGSQVAAWAQVVGGPQRAASWYALGSRLAREGARVNAQSANEQAVAALNRALVMDPRYAPARDLLEHLSLRATVPALRSTPVDLSDSSSAVGVFLRWRAAIAAGDSETVRSLRQDWPNASSENVRAIAMASQFDAIGFGDGALALRVLRSRATSTVERVDLLLAAHSLELNLGHSATALGHTAELKRLRPDSHAYLRLRVLDALYGGGDSAAAHKAVLQLAVSPDSAFDALPAAKSRVAADACVVAQWRLAQSDTSGIGAILLLLREPDLARERRPVTAAPRVCADLLEATRAVLTHDPRALALVDRLDELVLSSAVAGNASEYAHITVSRMYGALGHPHRALSALRRRTYMSGWPTYLATAWKEESRLARVVGDDQRAALSTGRVAALRAASITVKPTLNSP